MRSHPTSSLLLAVLILIGCSHGSRPTTSPELPVAQEPESAIPRSIGTDLPGRGPVVPPGPEGPAPEILDVTIDRTPLPEHAWATLHAVSNVSLAKHEWHLGTGGTVRSHSNFASLPIQSLQPGSHGGYVEGWDASGNRAMREFVIEVVDTPTNLIGVWASPEVFHVGEQVEVSAVYEGPPAQFYWQQTGDGLKQVASANQNDRTRARFLARHPGLASVSVTIGRKPNVLDMRSRTLHVAGVPELINHAESQPVLGATNTRVDMFWDAYGQPDDFEWDFGTGATRQPQGPLILGLQLGAPGLYSGRARAHNVDGWSEWKQFHYAVADSLTPAGSWPSNPHATLMVEGGKLWSAQEKWIGGEKHLEISWTESSEPFLSEATWSTCAVPVPHFGLTSVGINNCGRPVFILRGGDYNEWQLVMPTGNDPSVVENWRIRSLARLPAKIIAVAGSRKRIAVLSWNIVASQEQYYLSELKLGDSPGDEPGELQYPMIQVLSPWESGSNGSIDPISMSDGVGLFVHSDRISRIYFSIDGKWGSYELARDAAGVSSSKSELVEVNDRLFLLRTEYSKGKAPARTIMRSRTEFPLGAGAWEHLGLPAQIATLDIRPNSYPGSTQLWVGGYTIDAGSLASEFPEPSNWSASLRDVPAYDFEPWCEYQGAIYGRRAATAISGQANDVWRQPVAPQ